MEDAIALLQKQVFAVRPLDEAAWQDLAGAWGAINCKRKQVLTRCGDVEQYLYFVLEGVQRAFYLHGQREATIVFTYAPSFSGVLDSFFLRRPSALYLETLTASKLMRIHHHDLMDLMSRHPSIDQWVRIAVTQTLAGALDRQVELLCFTAEEKFTALLKRSPHLLNLIPHKYLASYIGIDPTNFSKLLGRVRLS